jgi:quinoprotein glucose dehydrogenase
MLPGSPSPLKFRSAAAAAAVDRRRGSERQQVVVDQALLAVSGSLISLLGGMLVIGAGLLADRSDYCTLAGSGLALAGILIAKRRREGAWLFMAVLALTLAWSLGNLQSGGVSLIMRLIGPALLLAMIALLMPALRGWRPSRTITVFATLLAGMIGLGLFSVAGGPLAGPMAALAQTLGY